ncbi:YopJ family acetyltransferase [Pandoraea sp. PE-S2T-3]|uniref:YopJ family acetyltransferase n=1 Tax=Pandoraea sp. PE-S2T-3 TaxID=1986993 RepID=UPI001595D351|nr:YopJ family acetyltransferase [Pandoraea sp. PE-S2T-3]
MRYSLPRTLRGYYNFSVAFLSAQKQCPSMAQADARFLPKLIESEAAHQSGMRISQHRSPDDLVTYLLQRCRLPEAQGREQGIVNMGPDGIHFAAFDLAIRDGQPSVILIESGSMNDEGGSTLAFRLCQAMTLHAPTGHDWPDRALLILETRMQQSSVDCGMFSLMTCKAMFKEASTFESLHSRLRAGEFDDAAFHHLPFDKTDDLLPPSIMRHTQSKRRLAGYAERHSRNADAEGAEIRRLARRQKGLTFDRENRSYSVSIEFERIKAAGRALPSPLESLEDTFLQS